MITGPYIDYGTKKKIISVTKSIVDKDGNFLGVAGIDIMVESL